MGAKQVTRTILLIQLLVTLTGAGISLAFSGTQAAYSALVGGGVSALVTLYFASQVFRFASAGLPPKLPAHSTWVRWSSCC
jgi:ATP synthase protein I